MLCLAGLILLVRACGGSNSTAPDVKQLIKDAQAAIRQVSSYHFKLVANNTGAGAKLPITSADGDIVVPDKLKENANELFVCNNVQVQIIAICNQKYDILFG